MPSKCQMYEEKNDAIFSFPCMCLLQPNIFGFISFFPSTHIHLRVKLLLIGTIWHQQYKFAKNGLITLSPVVLIFIISTRLKFYGHMLN